MTTVHNFTDYHFNMQKHKQTWRPQNIIVCCWKLLIAHTYNSSFRNDTSNLHLNLFIMQYMCVSEIHGITVWHDSSIQILEESIKKMNPWRLCFLAVALWETEVLNEGRNERLQTWDPPPSYAQTWCYSACTVMQQYLCANPAALLHYTCSVNTYLWKWLICRTCCAMHTAVKVSLPVCTSW
jgi:hypothetical protein